MIPDLARPCVCVCVPPSVRVLDVLLHKEYPQAGKRLGIGEHRYAQGVLASADERRPEPCCGRPALVAVQRQSERGRLGGLRIVQLHVRHACRDPLTGRRRVCFSVRRSADSSDSDAESARPVNTFRARTQEIAAKLRHPLSRRAITVPIRWTVRVSVSPC